MVIFVRSSNFENDIRGLKYFHYLKKCESQPLIISWDRLHENTNFQEHISYKKMSPYGRRWLSALNFLTWNYFLFIQLLKNRKNYQIIHVADFDSVLPCLLLQLIGKKVVYDIYDLFADSKFPNPNSALYKIFYTLEIFITQIVDLTILADPNRINQLSSEPKSVFYMENVPRLNIELQNKEFFESKNLTIIYAGALEKDVRGLEILTMYAQKNPSINLIIAGQGQLESYFIEQTKKFSNLKFYGKLSYEQAIKEIQKADLLYACYHKILRNSIFAAPNKFYDSLVTGTPLITTVGTLAGDKTNYHKTGFVIGEEYKDLEELLKSTNLRDEIITKSKNARNIWNNEYKHYLTINLDKYLSILKMLTKDQA